MHPGDWEIGVIFSASSPACPSASRGLSWGIQTLSCGMGLVWPGLNWRPWHWESRVLPTGSPGKSQKTVFWFTMSHLSTSMKEEMPTPWPTGSLASGHISWVSTNHCLLVEIWRSPINDWLWSDQTHCWSPQDYQALLSHPLLLVHSALGFPFWGRKPWLLGQEELIWCWSSWSSDEAPWGDAVSVALTSTNLLGEKMRVLGTD